MIDSGASANGVAVADHAMVEACLTPTFNLACPVGAYEAWSTDSWKEGSSYGEADLNSQSVKCWPCDHMIASPYTAAKNVTDNDPQLGFYSLTFAFGDFMMGHQANNDLALVPAVEKYEVYWIDGNGRPLDKNGTARPAGIRPIFVFTASTESSSCCKSGKYTMSIYGAWPAGYNNNLRLGVVAKAQDGVRTPVIHYTDAIADKVPISGQEVKVITGDVVATMSQEDIDALTADEGKAKEVFKKALAATLNFDESEVTITKIWISTDAGANWNEKTWSRRLTNNRVKAEYRIITTNTTKSATTVTSQSTLTALGSEIVAQAQAVAGITVTVAEMTATIPTEDVDDFATTTAPAEETGYALPRTLQLLALVLAFGAQTLMMS